MKRYLLPKDGNFYKTNLHCHTVVSDGCLSPEQVKEAYLAKGYSAVAFTDHEAFLRHNELSDDRFIAINGYETAIKDGTSTERTGDFMKVYHLNLLAKTPDIDAQVCFCPENFTPGNCAKYIPFLRYIGAPYQYRYNPEVVNHLIREANAHGFLVTYNHPRWSLQTAEDYSPLEGLHAVEVHNTGCVAQGDCNADAWATMLRMGKRLLPVAADDNHNGGGSLHDSFGGFTMIKAPALTYRDLMEAWEKGDAYASSHPLITELYEEGGYVTVRTSPVRTIRLCSEGRYTKAAKAEGTPLTEAAFPIPPEKCGAYFRIEAEDDEGRAYTRAYFFDEM